MASVHKHSSGRSPYWFAKFVGEDGRASIKSTKQTDRRKALGVAIEWEQACLKARHKALTETQCRRVLDEILERTTGERFRTISSREFLIGWLRGKDLARSKGTYQRYENSVRLFLKSVGDKAEMNVNLVLPKDIERFRDQELDDGKAPSTVNVDLKTLRGAFNIAFRQGLVEINPVNAIEFPKENRNERDVFSTEDVTSIVKEAEGEWRTAILFGFYLGARLGDAVTLKWSQIDLKGNVISYTQEKTKREISCPIHAALAEHLRQLKKSEDEQLVTPSLAALPVGGRNGLSRQFKTIMAEAGVKDGRIDGNGKRGRAFSKRSFHSLRHSFNSLLANSDVSQEIRMKLTGHSTESSNSIYTKFQLDPLRVAIGRLPSVCST